MSATYIFFTLKSFDLPVLLFDLTPTLIYFSISQDIPPIFFLVNLYHQTIVGSSISSKLTLLVQLHRFPWDNQSATLKGVGYLKLKV